MVAQRQINEAPHVRIGTDSFADRIDPPLSPDRSVASAPAAFDYRDTSKMGSSGPHACVQHESSLVGQSQSRGDSGLEQNWDSFEDDPDWLGSRTTTKSWLYFSFC